MNIEEIRKNWVNKADKDMDASIKMWDSASLYYKEKPMPEWESNDFLKDLNATIEMTKDMTVLDIGCGAGVYTIALAEKVSHAVGFDLSPKMIQFAKERAQKAGADNVEFIAGDWNEFDVKKEKFEKKFDLVFAHMSPGINSAETFEKMIACSKKHCFLVKSARRKDFIMDQVIDLAGIENNAETTDENITYAFQMLWELGYCPRFTCRQEEWDVEKPLEEAYIWYISRVKTYKTITEEEETKLKDYLKSVAVEGKIHDKTSTTVVTIYWSIS